MKTIPLTKGQIAVVDEDDYELISRIRWRARWGGSTFYAESGPSSDPTFMHRLLLSCPEHMEGDHRDGDGLNNRRYNLRIATRSQNCMNRPTWSRHGLKGVASIGSGWSAKIYINKKTMYLGYFQSAEDAARAYDEAAKVLHGDFARLNFP